MKELLTLSLLLFSSLAFPQSSRNPLAKSKLYVRATYFGENNKYIGLQTRTDQIDTFISKVMYRKFKTEDFTDYAGHKTTSDYYESFEDGVYTMLDSSLAILHKFNYQTNKEQAGILLSKPTQILLEFIDTQNSFPKDSLVPTEQTPGKYYRKGDPETYVLIIPDLKSVAVSGNKGFYTKLLYGENYNDISNGLINNYQVSTKFEIEKGDEIQLFYRRKWHNDTTGVAEYQDKQFKNIKYLGDTVVNNVKALKFEFEGYSYLSGSTESPEEVLVTVTNSGYNLGYQFVPFKTHQTDLKLFDHEGSKEFFMQGVTFDSIGTRLFPKIVQARSNDPYRSFILPYFPIPYIEFGNVEGLITYAKIKGVESGEKRVRTYITSTTNLREITHSSKNEVAITLYLSESTNMQFEVEDFESNKKLGELKASGKLGLHTFLIKTSDLEKGKEYRVRINYEGKTSSGSMSNSVKAKY